MDARAFVDELIASARQLSTQGRTIAEDRLGIPAAGDQRDAMPDGMGKGALAAGALAVLLGTGFGHRITGSALTLGGLAEIERFITARLGHPPGNGELAATIESPEAAAQVYLVSRLVIDVDNDAERGFVDDLVAAVGIAPELRDGLDRRTATDG
ncbi:MAG: DUF533 domain-containing protein [Gammaproteobacteria bacterium]|nr:DUF533 domain-containing protein [Gammaproteobacteria bacterium]